MMLNEVKATIKAIDPIPALPDQMLITGQLDDGQLIAAQAPRALVEQGLLSVDNLAVFAFPLATVSVGQHRDLVPWPEPQEGAMELSTAFVDPLGNQWHIWVRALESPEALADFVRTTELALRAEPITAKQLEASLSLAREPKSVEAFDTVVLSDTVSKIAMLLRLDKVTAGDLIRAQFMIRRTLSNQGGGDGSTLVQMENFVDRDKDGTLRFSHVVVPTPESITLAFPGSPTLVLAGSGTGDTFPVTTHSGSVAVTHTPGTTFYILTGELVGTIAP